jgi:hypothetical protein
MSDQGRIRIRRSSANLIFISIRKFYDPRISKPRKPPSIGIVTVMSQTSIELRQDPGREEGFASSGLDLTSTHENEASSLPPVDGGKDAWLFLAASFMVEALTWGESHLNLLDSSTDWLDRLPVRIRCIPRLLQYQCPL